MTAFPSVKQFWSTPRETLTDLGPRFMEAGRSAECVCVSRPPSVRLVEKLLARQPQH